MDWLVFLEIHQNKHFLAQHVLNSALIEDEQLFKNAKPLHQQIQLHVETSHQHKSWLEQF